MHGTALRGKKLCEAVGPSRERFALRGGNISSCAARVLRDIMRSLKKRAVIILLIVAAVFAVYAQALKNGFVWDDTALVLRDPFIRSWRLIAEGFRHFLFTDATASNFYRPLQRLTYTWDYAWFGLAPWGWHLSNILLHAAAAVMLFLFLEKLFAQFAVARGFEIAAVASLVWAIHPLHTSAVIYVAGRADLLAALFGFAGLYFALDRSWKAAPGAVLCFFAALLSKESGAMALVVALILLFIKRANPWRLLAPGIVMVAVYCALRFTAEHEPPPPPSEPVAAQARPLIAARAVAEYAGLLIAPVNLHMERTVLPFGRGDFATTVRAARFREYQTLLGVLLIIALVIWLRWTKRNDHAAFACLVAFVTAYLPISNLLPLNATVAEHWLYFPSAFLFTAAGLCLMHRRFSKPLLLAPWVLFLCVRTYTRNCDWSDSRTFFERTIANGGNSARMLMNLGGLESAQGHQRIAIGHFQNALQLAPDQPFALIGLGAAYLREGDFAHAREQFEKAAQNPFVRAEAIQDLAVLEFKENGKDRVDLLAQAAQSAPKNWAIQKRYIGHLDERGETARAIAELQRVLQTQWWRAESWSMLGDLWMHAGMRDSAFRAYEHALELDVHDDATRRKVAAL